MSHPQPRPDVVPSPGAADLAAALSAGVPWPQLSVQWRSEAGGQGRAGGRAHAAHPAHQPTPLPDSCARAGGPALP